MDKRKLKELIADDIGSAIKAIELNIDFSTEASNSLILIKTKYNRIKNDVRLNIIDRSESEKNLAQLTSALLSLIDDIKLNDWFEIGQNNKELHNSIIILKNKISDLTLNNQHLSTKLMVLESEIDKYRDIELKYNNTIEENNILKEKLENISKENAILKSELTIGKARLKTISLIEDKNINVDTLRKWWDSLPVQWKHMLLRNRGQVLYFNPKDVDKQVLSFDEIRDIYNNKKLHIGYAEKNEGNLDFLIPDYSILNDFIELRELSISDERFSNLKYIDRLNKLVDLDIGRTIVTDLKQLAKLTNLKNVRCPSSISRYEIADIRKLLPECEFR